MQHQPQKPQNPGAKQDQYSKTPGKTNPGAYNKQPFEKDRNPTQKNEKDRGFNRNPK